MSAAFDIIFVDGSGYLFRAFHALPPLTNKEGMPTGAVYGVLNMIKRLQKAYPGVDLVVVFDPPGKTKRHDVYSDYKANRSTMADDLRVQIEPLQSIIKAQGLPLFVVPNYEADDVIGTLATQAAMRGRNVLISTQDKDFAQLVGDRITLVDTMHNKMYDSEGVQAKFGIPPERIIDYLALVGDSSDNIPGVDKVGPKTAVKWLEKYGGLDAVIAQSAEVTGKVGEHLRAAIEHLPLYKHLVTIDTHVDIAVDDSQLQAGKADVTALKEWYKKLGFRTWYAELEVATQQALPVAQVIDNIEDCSVLVDNLLANDAPVAVSFYVDDEADYDHTIYAIGMVQGNAYYVVMMSVFKDVQTFLPWRDVMRLFAPLWQADGRRIIVWQSKMLERCLGLLDIPLTTEMVDVMLLGYIAHGPNMQKLSQLAYADLDLVIAAREVLFGQGAKRLAINQVTATEAVHQLQIELDALSKLGTCLCDKAKQDGMSWRLYTQIDRPLVSVISAMENRGVCVDAALLAKQSAEISQRVQALQAQAHTLAGEAFNLASPKQLAQVLYEKMQLPVLEKTPTGQPSTSEAVLLRLAEEYPLPACIIEHRGLAKLQSTYVDALPKMIHPVTGRVHSSFLQTSTSTGRLSSQKPNLQNIPIRTELGRQIRHAFVAPKGRQLVSIDYSQIELRIMAHISQDANLLKAFREGMDVHTQTAAEIFGVAMSQVDSEQRRYAKVINFGLIYGMSGFGLAKQLQISRQESEGYIKTYFSRYPGVAQYMEDCREQAQQQGYVATLAGRKLYFPDINSPQVAIRRASERACINAPMQGSAAELIKLAMSQTHRLLTSYGDRCYLVLQVHDELVFEVDEDLVDSLLPKLEQIMCEAMSLDVALEVSSGVGPNWGVIH